MPGKQKSAPAPVAVELPTTQRAYTMRLRGATDGDESWRDALWATHEAINKGAKAFGDWLLTLRGGLNCELAEPPAARRGAKDGAARRKSRRILLALSWLSVEDEHGAPPGPARIVSGREADSVRCERVVAALRTVLAGQRVGKREIDEWVADCAESLGARIREDAVWVNRSACFESHCTELKGLTRAYAQTSIMSFFGPDEDYFLLPDMDLEGGGAGVAGSDGPDFRTLARQWTSTNFGTGKKSDTDAIAAGLRTLANADLSRFAGAAKSDLIAHLSRKLRGPTPDMDGVVKALGWKGRPSKGRIAIDQLPDRLTKAAIAKMQEKCREESDAKVSSAGLRKVPKWMPALQALVERACGLPFVGDRDHIGEFSVMLDHAARRVSIGHSWIKRAEAERKQFESDAERLAEVPADATKWLDRFVAERSVLSGAIAAGGQYRIRRRAIGGWDAIVKGWKRASCRSTEDRVVVAREAQSDPEIDKFGDIQLFEALAASDAECVWRRDGKADHQTLRNFVLGHDAREKQKRFKVPAYRHPDALRHPVFGDFGNSRWSIEYAVHEAAKSAGASRKPSAADADWLKNRRGIRMGLWDGKAVRELPLRWASKRLAKDLALGSGKPGAAVRSVTRADRLGRAASGVGAHDAPVARGLFALADWNGRLQVSRAQLNALADHVAARGWDASAHRMRTRIKWLVTLSAKLECRGPFIDYVGGFSEAACDRPFITSKGEQGIKHEENEGRTGNAKLILSRLPSLRLLSVDLGHRVAAACAVWESLSVAELKAEIAGRTTVEGGTGAGEVFLHTRHADPSTKKDRTTIYRRIGADKLANGSLHPAPWARLDRQFCIKLQGEEQPTRAAASKPEHGANEMAMVAGFERSIGLIAESGEARSRSVDELMRRAVSLAATGLKRHARVAKIAYAMNPDCPGIPGMGGSLRVVIRGDDAHIQFLADALFDWHALATDFEWDGSSARALWNQLVAPLPGGVTIDGPSLQGSGRERPTRQKKRSADEEMRERILAPIARGIDPALAKAMFLAWRALWGQADGSPADIPKLPVGQRGPAETAVATPASGWHAHLRTLTDWIMGRRLAGAKSGCWARNVGGIGLTRITTMRSLYQLHKAFDMRARPDRVQGAPTRGDDNSGIAKGILDSMERMRGQRVKQLASRIVEAALGVGRKTPAEGTQRERKRPQLQVDRPCHAVVVENLRTYRPDELQTRRENKALMVWSSGKVRKYLEEGCQLHGLYLRDVMPNYTSRQCSRTGSPGMRCVDVSIHEFLGSRYWVRVVTAACDRLAEGGTDSNDAMLRDLHSHWSKASEAARRDQGSLRLLKNGAELFVAAPVGKIDRATARRATQADLNAAANIGLRALLDPDFMGRWWYVPCDSATGRPSKEKCAGAACLKVDSVVPGMAPGAAAAPGDKKSTKDGKSREITNAWRDLNLGSSGGDWMAHGEYWGKVRFRIVARLRVANGLH